MHGLGLQTIAQQARPPSGSGGPPPDETAPQRVGNPVVAADGLSIAITYDETLASVPSHTAVSLSGTPVLANGSSGAGTAVWTIALDSPILGSETVTLTTTAGPEDAAENEAATMSGQATTNGSGIELETVTKHYVADWSLADTEYAPHRPIMFVTWGAGGGGAGGSAQGGSGAGGAIQPHYVASALPGGYSGTAGAGGATATDATAATGGDSTVSDTGGVIARAVGGPGGTGGVTGIGGVGTTTGCVGNGTAQAGGNGNGGAGGQIGGGTSGTTSAASGSTPGAPEGAVKLGTGAGQFGCGGGCTSGGGTPAAGGGGCFLVTYQRAVVAAVRPRILGIRYGRTTANVTTFDVELPDGSDALDVDSPQAGDVYVCVVAQDGTDTSGAMTGWIKVAGGGGNSQTMIFALDYAGSDPVAVTTASERSSWHTYLIRGCSGAADITATVGAVSGQDPDPPSHDHGSVVDALWFTALGSIQGNGAQPQMVAYPAGWDDQQNRIGAVSNTGTSLHVGFRELLATQIADPGVWDTEAAGSSTNGGGAVCCIPKA